MVVIKKTMHSFSQMNIFPWSQHGNNKYNLHGWLEEDNAFGFSDESFSLGRNMDMINIIPGMVGLKNTMHLCSPMNVFP